MKIFLLFIIVASSPFLFSQKKDSVSVFFDINSAKISVFDEKKMSEFQSRLKNNEVYILLINGYTDTSGSVKLNANLANKRVNAVLNNLNLKSGTVKTKVIGESYSVSAIYDAEKMRRVDILFSSKNSDESNNTTSNQSDSAQTDNPATSSNLVGNLYSFLSNPDQKEVTLALTINFIPGEAIILAESEKELQELFVFLRQNENIIAKIRGHVCCADDYELSHARARFVYDYLAQRTISPKRLSYNGYSNKMPVVSPEITEEDRIKNRRVDVVFIKMPK